ncbi:hypothetical protein ACJX0J_034816, partial [Zea mays]
AGMEDYSEVWGPVRHCGENFEPRHQTKRYWGGDDKELKNGTNWDNCMRLRGLLVSKTRVFTEGPIHVWRLSDCSIIGTPEHVFNCISVIDEG